MQNQLASRSRAHVPASALSIVMLQRPFWAALSAIARRPRPDTGARTGASTCAGAGSLTGAWSATSGRSGNSAVSAGGVARPPVRRVG